MIRRGPAMTHAGREIARVALTLPKAAASLLER
jgi:hypothetical protein